MSKKPSAWTPEEKIALFAAVEQCRATGGQLDWGAIAVTVPGRSAHAAEVQYYELQRVRSLSCTFPHPGPPPSIFRRPCLRCRRSFDLPGSKAELDLQFVQRTDSWVWVDRRLIHIHPDRA